MVQRQMDIEDKATKPGKHSGRRVGAGAGKIRLTSRMALDKCSADSQRGRLIEYLRKRGARGATDQEAAEALELGESVRPRRRELEKAGLVKESGNFRQTHSGKMAIVWVAAAIPDAC
jgi:hypothetical protein